MSFDWSIGFWAPMWLPFLFIALLEIRWPRHSPAAKSMRRWRQNFLMLVANTGVSLSLFTLLGFSYLSESANFGWRLLSQIGLPAVLDIALSVVLLDCLAYGLHRLQHLSPLLWRIHRVHHSQRFLDLSCGWLFHPMEAILSLAAAAALIFILGLAPLGVGLYGFLTYAVNLWVHSNYCVSPPLERGLGLLFITPTQHHQHHSLDGSQSNHNFGVLFNIWDKLFGSLYRGGHSVPNYYGVNGLNIGANATLADYLLMPFKSK